MFNLSTTQRSNIWDYVVENEKNRPYGLTLRRLEKMKPTVLDGHTEFWTNMAMQLTADEPVRMRVCAELKDEDTATYEHLVGNFWNQVSEIAHRLGVVRS